MPKHHGWIVPKGATVHECPRCGHESLVTLQNQYGLWVSKQAWECPNCEEILESEDLND